MLIIETRIPPILFANILHYLKEEHHITPRNRSEALRLSITLLAEFVPDTFRGNEDSAMEYILSVCGGRLGRDKRMNLASQAVADEGKKRVDSAIEDAVKKFREKEDE